MKCSVYKCNNEAIYDIAMALGVGTPEYKLVQFYTCKSCGIPDSECIKWITRFNPDEERSNFDARNTHA